jgi:FtsH-binding integral membrane protein
MKKFKRFLGFMTGGVIGVVVGSIILLFLGMWSSFSTIWALSWIAVFFISWYIWYYIIKAKKSKKK